MPNRPASLALTRWLTNLTARQRLALAVVVGLACGWLAPADFRLGTRIVTAWDGFSVCFLLLVWPAMATAEAADIRRIATTEDPGSTWTFVAVLVAATASLLAVVLLLSGLARMAASERALRVSVSLVAVLGAWVLLHTLFALRYAHGYFSEDPRTKPPDQLGGLEFAGAAPTTYWDFAYFSFVVGMTAQTADVAIASLRMRKLVLLHGVLSFGFNTAVVALTINVLSGLL